MPTGSGKTFAIEASWKELKLFINSGNYIVIVQGSVGSKLRIFLLANHNISQEMNNIRLLGRTPRPSNWLGKCRHFLLPHSVVIRIFISALLVLSMDRRAIIRKDLPCPPLRPLRGQVPQMVGKAEVPWGLRQVLPGRRPPSPPQVEG